MYIIDATEIIIPKNRQRREFPNDDKESLKLSIQTRGLLHPIVLRNDRQTLVCGERRLRAMTELHQLDISFTCNGTVIPPGSFPCTILSELSPLEIEEAELEENILRVDLNFIEKAQAIDRLHNLRVEQAQIRGETHTQSETSEKSGIRCSTVNESIALVRHLDSVPEIRKAKNHAEAIKIVRKTLETRERAKLAEEFKKVESPHTIHLGDSMQFLKDFEDSLFDLLLTDPPYGVGADAFGSQAGVAHNYEDSEESALKLYDILAIESFRCTKEQAHAYVFCDIRLFPRISLLFTLAGWSVWQRPFIWSKRNGMVPQVSHGPRQTYEALLFANKGNKKTTGIRNDVLDYGQVQNQLHAAEKPVDLLRDLISRSCRPGDSILDPFAGSGSTLEAAELEHCKATLVELNEDNYNICLERQKKLEIVL